MGKVTKINLWGLDFCIAFAALKPKLTRLKSGSFLLIEIIKIRFQFDLVYVKIRLILHEK